MRRALAFLTPFGRALAPSPSTFAWFAPVGAAIGLAVGSIWWFATKAWPPAAAAAVALASDVALTGYLHLDGLADAADGLLPPLLPERRLAVMADPSVGAFGLVTVAVVLLMRYGALASARPSILVVGALWCCSRASMAVVAFALPYARPVGLASAFLEGPAPSTSSATGGRSTVLVPVLLGIALSVLLAVLGRGTHGLAALGAETAGTAAVALLAKRRIGGFTGDVLGAAGVVGETLGLLVLAARS